MQKALRITLIFLAAASLLPNSIAQQTPPAKTQPAAPPKSPQGTTTKRAPTDTVVFNYRGTLLDNPGFDRSHQRGQAAAFPVTKVIKGWTEALQLMPVGSKWQPFVPADLAYGEGGFGGQIGPNATLIFEVELLSIQSKDAK